MSNRNSTRSIAVGLSAIAISAGLKYYYSTATVNDLTFVLSPTAFLVELVTNETFRFESYAGYMNADHSFLIASSCSGINFLITSFLMLVLVPLWRNRNMPAKWRLLPFALIAAYLATILANTVRVSVALLLHRMDADLIWINPEQLHRFEGIFVYFGFLLILFVLTEGSEKPHKSHVQNPSLAHRRFLIPLVVYWAMTLAVPLANGAYRQGAIFWEHCAFVLLAPLFLLLPLLSYRFIKERFGGDEDYAMMRHV